MLWHCHAEKNSQRCNPVKCLNNNVLSHHGMMDIDVILVTSGLYLRSARSEHFYCEVCCLCFSQPHKMQKYMNCDWKLFSLSDCFLDFFTHQFPVLYLYVNILCLHCIKRLRVWLPQHPWASYSHLSAFVTTSELWCLSGGKKGDYLFYILSWSCAQSWAVIKVLWIGFCHTGPISLCVDLFVFFCVYLVCFCFILHSCCIIVTRWGGLDGIEV